MTKTMASRESYSIVELFYTKEEPKIDIKTDSFQ